MNEYSNSELNGASFLHDDELSDFQVSEAELSFRISDIYLPKKEQYAEREVRVKIHQWSDLKILRYDSNTESTEEVAIRDSAPISSICECEISDGKIVLEGFEKSKSLWQSYVFVQPSIVVTEL